MATSLEQSIIQILSDGKFHSGEQIAKQLGMTRASVWKKIRTVKNKFGLDIHAVSGKGYWMPKKIELLEERLILQLLDEQCDISFASLKVHEQIDSTNRYMLDNKLASTEAFSACLAELQTQGKGRRGRQWLSPFGRSIQLSVGCLLNVPMSQLSGLSIAIGVAIAEMLNDIGLIDVALKWPNDIHVNGQKLAGVLVELKGEAEGPVKTVIGVGLNVDIPKSLSEKIDQPVTDLKQHLAGNLPGRNQIAAALLKNVSMAIEQFVQQGLIDFVNRWQCYDHYQNKEIVIKNAVSEISGIYRGLDETGALLLQTEDGIVAINAGEVSMRHGDVR